MRTLLIVFAILLFLLICLAAFGGTITYSEPFYETSQVYTSPRFNADVPPQLFESSASISVPQMPPISQGMSEGVPQFAPPTSVSQNPPQMPISFPQVPPIGQQGMPQTEQFYGNTSSKSRFEDESPDYVNEGFIIEPFEVDNHSMPASY